MCWCVPFSPFQGSFLPVDEGILFSQPWKAKDDLLLSESGDEEYCSFLLSTYVGLESGKVGDHAFLVRSSVYVEYFDGDLESCGGESFCSDEVLIDEGPSCSAVNKGFGVDVFLFTLQSARERNGYMHSLILNLGY